MHSCFTLYCNELVKFFSKLNYFIYDTLTKQIIFLIIKTLNFWGDLNGISAKTETLNSTSEFEYTLSRIGYGNGHKAQ